MFRQQHSNVKALPILELSLQFFEVSDGQPAPLDLLSHDGESKNGIEGVEKPLIDMGFIFIRFHSKKIDHRSSVRRDLSIPSFVIEIFAAETSPFMAGRKPRPPFFS